MWHMDSEGRFSLGSDEFTRLIGPNTAAGFGRLWHEIAEMFGLDPEGLVEKAIATRAYLERHRFGLAGRWRKPIAGRIVGPPDLRCRARNFRLSWLRHLPRYRGPVRLAAQRDRPSFDAAAPQSPSAADILQAGPAADMPPADMPVEELADPTDAASPSSARSPDPTASETSQQTDLETTVEPPKDDTLEDTSKETPMETLTGIPAEAPTEAPMNVLPFRAPGDAKPLSLTPVENSAFNELARQLSARLDTENGTDGPEGTGGPRSPASTIPWSRGPRP